MKAAPNAIENHDAAVHGINEALQGPVVDILARLLPEVAALPRQDALELILDDVDLLYRCFVAFRTNLTLFRPLLVDARRRPVEDSETTLSCGRTLDQIEAMVVRTAAKRYLRHRLDHEHRRLRDPSCPPRPRDKAGVFARLRALLSGRPKRVRPKSRADILYDALNPLLTRDWQLPLVPEYSQLSLGMVRRLGPRLLDYRAPEDIRRLKIDPDRMPPATSVELLEYLGLGAFGLPPVVPPAAATVPKVADTRQGGSMAAAPELEAPAPASSRRCPVASMAGPGGTLKTEAFTPVLLDPKVQAVLPPSPSLKPGSELRLAGAAMAGRLVDALDLDTAQLTVLLMTAAARLGERHFTTAFGIPGRPDYLDRIIARGRAEGIGPNSGLPDIAAFVARLFNTDAGRR